MMYPNPAQPVHAVFVHRRISHVAQLCDVRVLSPIPYFPFAWHLKRYAHRRRIPSAAKIDGVAVSYPRFLSVPKFLKPLDGILMFLAVWWHARKLRQSFDPDVIDTQLAYPDGYAGLLLARLLGKPMTVTLRGHDINVFPGHPIRRRQIVRALRGASRVMSVADALRRAAVELGCPEERTETIPNAVDGRLFYPEDRQAARDRLGLPADRQIVISVGHLVERKGHHLVLEAMRRIKQRDGTVFYYVIVGAPGEEGNTLPALRQQVADCGLSNDVLFAGAVLNEELGDWYSAADASCLASAKEGWANVLLESLACGTPVVATNVWGTPEVIREGEHGALVERTAESIAGGLVAALSRAWDRGALTRYARSFNWSDVARRVVENYESALRAAERNGGRVGEGADRRVAPPAGLE
jgi:glycosyltransferase involved in cell wall biosynthesis